MHQNVKDQVNHLDMDLHVSSQKRNCIFSASWPAPFSWLPLVLSYLYWLLHCLGEVHFKTKNHAFLPAGMFSHGADLLLR